MEKKDIVNYFAGASMLFTTACASSAEANVNKNADPAKTETPISQQYVAEATEEPKDYYIEEEKLPRTCIAFGSYGTYCEEFNNYTGKNEITWHEHSKVEQGESDLVDLKIEGGIVEFEMPKAGVMNSIAGEIEVTFKDEQGLDVTEKFTPGNPAVDANENPIIPAGASVSVDYEPNDDSNGLALIFEEEMTFENLRMDWGEYGISKAVYDENKKAWIVALDEWSLVKNGVKNLENLKIEGGQFEFIMPFDGYIHNTAGEISSDEEKLRLGNPVEDENGNTLIHANEKITITYGPKNVSAAFSLEFPAK